ncbi:MAG TPA: ankyrin repeat domain-containing protein [Armatimonadota bacterium]|nr:ankyrin repeat domain-containing protein [Armatimonadota bacterium]
MPQNVPPTRTLRESSDLNQLKRQAKELRTAFLAGEPDAVAEVNAHYSGAHPTRFALHEAQLALARSYGFGSWPKLKAYVDGSTISWLAEAVRAGDLSRARAMLKVRPELAGTGIDNYQPLHYAVLNRNPEMVGLLMEHGANAREGVYPHRDATTALTMAIERGFDEIVAIINAAEQRRRAVDGGRDTSRSLAPDELFRAIAASETARAIALLESESSLIHSRDSDGWAPLHLAAQKLNELVVQWLLDHGADAKARGRDDRAPLDLAAEGWGDGAAESFPAAAALLLKGGAVMTARAAVALGETDWLRTRHDEGALVNSIEDSGGLLRIAVTHNRPEVLALLLSFGFDPDERKRLGVGDGGAFTWGMPLWHCAGAGKYEMAQMLLTGGADPNAQVYASGDPVFQAYSQCDWKMVKLLERYGGIPTATTAGLYRQTDLARKMLSGAAVYRLDGVGGTTVAEQPLWGAACGGDPEIVRAALEQVNWPRDDVGWLTALEQPLRMWRHGSGNPEWDRGAHLICFKLLLQRCDPNIRGREPDRGQFGLTILHSVAGSRDHVTPEERVGFANALLDAGARLDLRDNLLKSTPLGWACRWGRIELVKLFLERGADPLEPDAESWATPRAWAEKRGVVAALAALDKYTS